MSDRFFEAVIGVQVLVVVLAVIGTVAGAYLAWTRAPPVGGGWWPYVRVAATLVGAIVGAKIGVLVGALVGVVIVLGGVWE